MSTIAQRLEQIRAQLPQDVRLVAVSKFHPVEAILEAYAAGQRLFGENRVQELARKVADPRLQALHDLRWHLLGHLQTNKVRQVIDLHPALIESVDSERLLALIDAQALKSGIVQHVLLELHVAAEETKTGFSPDAMLQYFRHRRFETLRATHIDGIMGMATNTDDPEVVSTDFAAIASVFAQIRALCPDLRGFDTLSMGMSHDFPLAVAQGANMVRVGTAIFGPRQY